MTHDEVLLWLDDRLGKRVRVLVGVMYHGEVVDYALQLEGELRRVIDHPDNKGILDPEEWVGSYNIAAACLSVRAHGYYEARSPTPVELELNFGDHMRIWVCMADPPPTRRERRV